MLRPRRVGLFVLPESQDHSSSPAQKHPGTWLLSIPGPPYFAFPINRDCCAQGKWRSLQSLHNSQALLGEGSCRVAGGAAGQPSPAVRRMGQEAERRAGAPGLMEARGPNPAHLLRHDTNCSPTRALLFLPMWWFSLPLHT